MTHERTIRNAKELIQYIQINARGRGKTRNLQNGLSDDCLVLVPSKDYGISILEHPIEKCVTNHQELSLVLSHRSDPIAIDQEGFCSVVRPLIDCIDDQRVEIGKRQRRIESLEIRNKSLDYEVRKLKKDVAYLLENSDTKKES